MVSMLQIVSKNSWWMSLYVFCYKISKAVNWSWFAVLEVTCFDPKQCPFGTPLYLIVIKFRLWHRIQGWVDWWIELCELFLESKCSGFVDFWGRTKKKQPQENKGKLKFVCANVYRCIEWSIFITKYTLNAYLWYAGE